MVNKGIGLWGFEHIFLYSIYESSATFLWRRFFMSVSQMGNGGWERSRAWPWFTLADSGSELKYMDCCLMGLLRNSRKWWQLRKQREGAKTKNDWTYCILSSVPSILQVLSELVLTTNLWGNRGSERLNISCMLSDRFQTLVRLSPELWSSFSCFLLPSASQECIAEWVNKWTNGLEGLGLNN